jgi:hypothetical protein
MCGLGEGGGGDGDSGGGLGDGGGGDGDGGGGLGDGGGGLAARVLPTRPLQNGPRVTSARKRSWQCGSNAASSSTSMQERVERLPAPAHSANSVAERPSRVGLALPRRFRSRAKSVGRALFLFY